MANTTRKKRKKPIIRLMIKSFLTLMKAKSSNSKIATVIFFFPKLTRSKRLMLSQMRRILEVTMIRSVQ